MSSFIMPDDATACCHVTVPDPFGLHARPAAQLVRTASEFDADVTLHHGSSSASAKSIIGILRLCAQHGERLAIVARGADAAEAVQAIKTLFLMS